MIYKAAFVSLMLTCLISTSVRGQYQQMKKGEFSTFARSVNIEISEYVKIRAKVFLVDSLIQAVVVLKHDQETATKSFMNQAATYQADLASKDRTIASQATTIGELNQNFQQLDNAWKKWRIVKSPFWDGVLKVAGAAGVGYIAGKTF